MKDVDDMTIEEYVAENKIETLPKNRSFWDNIKEIF